VVEPAILCFLVFLARLRLVFGARQRRTGAAVPVTMVASSANYDLLMTTLAFEDSAIL
jgi:hypothetical protein